MRPAPKSMVDRRPPALMDTCCASAAFPCAAMLEQPALPDPARVANRRDVRSMRTMCVHLRRLFSPHRASAGERWCSAGRWKGFPRPRVAHAGLEKSSGRSSSTPRSLLQGVWSTSRSIERRDARLRAAIALVLRPLTLGVCPISPILPIICCFPSASTTIWSHRTTAAAHSRAQPYRPVAVGMLLQAVAPTSRLGTPFLTTCVFSCSDRPADALAAVRKSTARASVLAPGPWQGLWDV